MTTKHHGRFYSNVIWQYGLQAVKYLFPLITVPYLTRVLEPHGYAVYAYVLAFMSFAQTFIDFGFNLSGTKKIARATTIAEQNKIIGAVTEARILLSVIVGLAVTVIALFLPITRANILYTMLSYFAVTGRGLAPDFLFQGHETMGPLTTRFLISKGFSTALTFVCVSSINDILWIPILDIASSIIALIWSFAAAYRIFGTRIAPAPPRSAISELRESGLYGLSNISSVALTGFTTLLIGAVIHDKTLVAYWSVSMTSVSAIQSLYSPISNSLYPHMVVHNDFRFARKVIIILLPAVLLGTFLFASCSDLVMLILGGQQYVSGAWIIRWVSPLLFFSFFTILLGWPVLGASGKVREITTTTVFSALLCIALLSLATIAGIADLKTIAVIRCISEAALFFTRAWYARHYIFANK